MKNIFKDDIRLHPEGRKMKDSDMNLPPPSVSPQFLRQVTSAGQVVSFLCSLFRHSSLEK